MLTSFFAKEICLKNHFCTDNDQYGVVSLLHPQRVNPGASLHYETQAFNPLLNTHPELSILPLKLRRISVFGSLLGGTRDGRQFTYLFLPLKTTVPPTEKKTREW